MKNIFQKYKRAMVIFLIIIVTTLVFIPTCRFLIIKKQQRDEYLVRLNEAKNTHVVFNQERRQGEYIGKEDDFEGVGIIYDIKMDVVFISEVIKNSPADKAGLKSGDRIIKIDGRYVFGMTMDEVSDLLRGPRGTKITLNIYRDSFGERSKDFLIIRDFVDNSERRNYFLFVNTGQGGEDLGNNYKRYGDRVYYQKDSNDKNFNLKTSTVFLADSNSFVSLESVDCQWKENSFSFDLCEGYGKDKARVFYGYLEIKDADPGTFQVLKRSFSKDKNYVFYLREKIEGLNPEKFEMLKSGLYGKDENFVVYEGKKIAGADSKTFQVLYEKSCPYHPNALAKDKNGYYFGENKITENQYYENMKKIVIEEKNCK